MDYPGFGLSEGLHCYIESFDGLIDDVIEHYSKVKGNHGHLSGYLRISLTLNIFPEPFGFSDSCRCLDFMYSSHYFDVYKKAEVEMARRDANTKCYQQYITVDGFNHKRRIICHSANFLLILCFSTL